MFDFFFRPKSSVTSMPKTARKERKIGTTAVKGKQRKTNRK